MNDLEKLITHLEVKNYGDLIMPFFGLIAIIIGILNVRKERIGVLFLVYLFFDFIVSISDTYIDTFSSLTRKQVQFYFGLTNDLISLVELLAYYYFFSKILHNNTILKLMRISATIFVVMVLLLVTTKYSFLTDRFYYITDLIGAIEFLFMLFPCVAYFYKLFQNDSADNLLQRPSFWIVTGIFFYSLISIPYYLISNFISQNHRNYLPLTFLLFYSIPLSINFIFLIRAFLCRKTLTI